MVNKAADELDRLTADYAAATHLLADRDAQIERLKAELATLRAAAASVQADQRAEIDAANAVIDELREDAECYRWIAAYCRSTAEHWGGRWSIVVEGPAPTRDDDEDAFRAAIDAARALRKGAQNV